MFVCSLLSPWKKKSSFFFSPLVFPRFFSFSLKISLLSLPSFFSFSYVEDATDLFHGRTLWILIVPLFDWESFSGWLFPSKRYWNRFFHLINSSICLFAFHHFFSSGFPWKWDEGRGAHPLYLWFSGPQWIITTIRLIRLPYVESHWMVRHVVHLNNGLDPSGWDLLHNPGEFVGRCSMHKTDVVLIKINGHAWWVWSQRPGFFYFFLFLQERCYFVHSFST